MYDFFCKKRDPSDLDFGIQDAPLMSHNSHWHYLLMVRIKEPISGITDSWENVPSRSQLLVYGPHKDIDVGMGLLQESHALFRAEESHKDDFLQAPVFEDIDGLNGRSGSRNHGVDYKSQVDVTFGRELIVVLDCCLSYVQ